MSKIELNNIVNTQNVQLINDNFQKIEDVINEKMLSRNPEGEPNSLQAPLDLNNQRVLNAPKPTQPTDLVRLQDITSSSGGDVDLSGKQDTLVSGVNIKTVNNESLLGSGNINVTGGGGTSDHSQLLNRTLPDQHNIASITGLQSLLDSKQNNLVSGTTLKTVNGNSLLGSGDIVISGGGGGTTDHSALTNRNLADQHSIAAVTGLQAALDGKANTSHVHTLANVTGLQTALDGKQPIDGDLTAIAALSTNGVPRRTGTDTWAMLVDVKEIVVSTTAPTDTTKLWLDIN